MDDNGSLYNNKIKKLKNLLPRYEKLGFKLIPLEGKKPFWKGWDDPKLWEDGTYNNELTLKTLELDPKLNVGIVTGEPSKIIRIDVDQPKILGWNPEPAINKGALAHTTSRGDGIVIRSENPEVLAFSKKLVKKRDEIDENLLLYEEDEEKQAITIIEILGNGRQFVAPPSIHPDKGVEYEWITPIPETPNQILTVNSIEELYSLLLECCENKGLINELFEEYFRLKAREETGEEGKKADEILEKWLKIILKHLDVAKEGNGYILCHCPFHPPDEHPSFAIYENTYLAVDFHDGKIYKLKELAEALDIELPHIRSEIKGNKVPRSEIEKGWKEYRLEEFGITIEELERVVISAIELNKNGEPKGIKHGVFANFLREKFVFVTNSITEEIWRYDPKEGIYKPDGEAFIKNLCERILNALGLPEFATIRRISEIVHHIKRHPQIHPSEFNKAWREGWINCKNGVLNIYTGEFKPHSPEFFFTWRINAEYNPESQGVYVEKFLSSVVPPDKRELLEEIVAYCLMPGQPYKKFFVLLGPTDSGKSTFIHLLEQFLGKDNVANLALQEIENGRFALAELVGKLANCFADLPAKKLSECPRIKAITGEDTLTIEEKFQKPYFAKIDAKLIFSANRLPEVDETDAFWNRAVIIQFPYRFKKDEEFKQKLIQPNELSALLNIALRALKRLQEKRFEDEDASATVRLWRIASDPLAVFVDECIEVMVSEDEDFFPADVYEFKGDVFDAFKVFCAQNGVETPIRDFHIFCREFTQAFRDKGIQLKEGRKEREDKLLRVWYGIRLKCRHCDKCNGNNRIEKIEKRKEEESELDETDRQILACYKLIASSVPDYDQPIAFAKMVAKKLGDPEEIKGRILKLIELGKLPDFYKQSVEGFWRNKKDDGCSNDEANENNSTNESKPIEEPSKEVRERAKLYGFKTIDTKLKVIDEEERRRQKTHYQLVKFFKDCPEFVGVDGEIYGPFKQGDTARIPSDNVIALIRGGYAKICSSGGDKT